MGSKVSSLLCGVQLIALVFFGFGIFMMTTLPGLVDKFLEPNMENVRGKFFSVRAFFII